MFLTETWSVWLLVVWLLCLNQFFTARRSRWTSTAVLNCSFLRLIFLRLLCAVVYRPPKYNKNFIQDFADFVAGIALIYDRFFYFIMGDFNIHVCCESKLLVKEFLSLIDSFNLTQSVTGPTHEKGHILDLVLSYGLCITINEICDRYFRSPACLIYCGCFQFGDFHLCFGSQCAGNQPFNCLTVL